jgi:uncharacterized membrane protein
MYKALVMYVAVLAGILVLDAFWLGALAKRFYADKLGYLTAPNVVGRRRFYLLFAAGVTYCGSAPGGGGCWGVRSQWARSFRAGRLRTYD